jgi:hypothetical protein
MPNRQVRLDELLEANRALFTYALGDDVKTQRGYRHAGCAFPFWQPLPLAARDQPESTASTTRST